MSLATLSTAVWTAATRTLVAGSIPTPTTQFETTIAAIWAYSDRTLSVITPTGGIEFGGSAYELWGATHSCPCHTFVEIPDGGLSFGGEATVTDTMIVGGLCFGGSAIVDSSHTWDGMEAVWGLNEDANGTAGEYLDSTEHGLHGTGGDGSGNYVPVQDDGVFCLESQHFSGWLADREYIEFPADSLGSSESFTVSLWCKSESEYAQRYYFSRGFDAGASKWVFSLGHSVINHLWASIQLVTDEDDVVLYDCYSSTLMARERFYHVAATWIPGESLSVFINGVLEGTIATPETTSVSLDNGSYAGRFNRGGFFEGNIQEIRLSDERSEAWLKAEYDNFCDPNFYVSGVWESAVFE